MDTNSEAKNTIVTGATPEQAARKAWRKFKWLETIVLIDSDDTEFIFDTSDFELSTVKKPQKKSGGAKPRDRLAYEAGLLSGDD